MNTNHDELERLLGEELSDRAGVMGGSRLQLSDVRGRATSIRRRRRLAAGVGVAAALAVIVPTAVGVGGALRSSDVPPANPAPTEPVHTTLTLDGLAWGGKPAIEYFDKNGVVLTDDGPRPTDERWQAMVPSDADGGWVALGPARDEVVTLVDDFQRLTSSAATGGFVSNPDRSQVAWTSLESGAQTLLLNSTTSTDPADSMAWTFPERPVVDPVDFTGPQSVLYQTTENDGSQTFGIANEDGSTTPLKGFVSALSANPTTGLVAVQTQVNRDESGCFGVMDPDVSTTEPLWETCNNSLGAFSPDGRYVLASQPYLSGFGLTSIAVLDAETGDLVASFEQEQGSQISLVNVAWESDDTFVAVASEGNQTSIVRFGVDGMLNQAVAPVKGDPYSDVPFYFGADRMRKF